MKVFICSKEYEKSLSKLEELSKQIDNIKEFRKGKYETYIETYNGDYYRIVPYVDGMKANRCDKLYIGEELDKKFIEVILLPMLVLSNIPNSEQIIYF